MGNTSSATPSSAKSLYQLFCQFFGPSAKYTILVLGQTGSGKTSFLNLMANLRQDAVRKTFYSPGYEITQEQLREFVKETISDEALENAIHDPMASKTSNAKIYHMSMGAAHLTVIDTPGFGDSRGLEEDRAHVERIMDALKGIGGVNCILLTINGREARLTTTLQYVLCQLTSIMPQTVLDNVAVVFTNTDKERNLNFDRAKLTDLGFRDPQFICLDNPLCSIQKMCPADKSLNDEELEDASRMLKLAVKNVENLLSKIMLFPSVETLRFTELNNQRMHIENCLVTILEKHSQEESRIKSLEKIKEDILRTGEVCPRERHYTEWELRPGSHQWSRYVCQHEGCHSNCDESTVVSPLARIWRNFNLTTVCTACGHTYESHLVSRDAWVRHDRSEVVNLGELKKAKSAKERMEIALQQLEQAQTKALDEKCAIALSLQDSLAMYAQLGMPTAYERLLRAQKMLLKERIEANPEDSTLQNMLQMIDHFLNEVERNAELLCCICMDGFATVTLRSCGHDQFCAPCGELMGTCPICRAPVDSVEARTASTPSGVNPSVSSFASSMHRSISGSSSSTSE